MLSTHKGTVLIKNPSGQFEKVTVDNEVNISDCHWRDDVPEIHWKLEDSKTTRITPFPKLYRHFRYNEPVFNNYLTRWLNVHSNQFKAGMEIIDHFECGINNVILMAEMQSGKTGTVRYVAHWLLHCHHSLFTEKINSSQMFFICGMNDNDLRRQAIKEFEGIIPEDNILFSKQLQKWNRVGSSTNNVRFLIIDESHYASNINSQIDQFVKSISTEQLLVVSVSATAMAELATSTAYEKGRIYLRPGTGYYSITELFKRDRVRQSMDITNNQSNFIDLVTEIYQHQKEHDEKKYNIIRIPNQWYYKDLQDDISEMDLDIHYINHHTTESICVNDFNKYLTDEPEKTTIIWIYNSLRAGKQLNTEHVGAVHDTAKSTPDTIAQSLLGRILGYNKRNDHVICYTDLKSARLFLHWVSNLYDITKIPTGSRGIKNGYTETSRTWKLHPPILVVMNDEMRRHYRTLKQRHSNRYPYKADLIRDLILSSSVDRSDLEDIFENYKPGRCGGVMALTEDNTLRSFSEHWSRNYQCHLDKTPIRGFDAFIPGNYFYIYANLNLYSSDYGKVLITYKEYVNNTVSAEYVNVSKNSRFALPLT